jgi:hypothetical protein
MAQIQDINRVFIAHPQDHALGLTKSGRLINPPELGPPGRFMVAGG